MSPPSCEFRLSPVRCYLRSYANNVEQIWTAVKWNPKKQRSCQENGSNKNTWRSLIVQDQKNNSELTFLRLIANRLIINSLNLCPCPQTHGLSSRLMQRRTKSCVRRCTSSWTGWRVNVISWRHSLARKMRRTHFSSKSTSCSNRNYIARWATPLYALFCKHVDSNRAETSSECVEIRPGSGLVLNSGYWSQLILTDKVQVHGTWLDKLCRH